MLEQDCIIDELAVCVTIRELPYQDYPVLVHREQDVTVVAIDPTASRMEVVMGCTQPFPEGLDAEELDAVRSGYGMAPAGQGYAPDDLVSDKPCLLFVPQALRVDGEPALQGGAELARRRDVGGLLEDEYAWLAAEQSANVTRLHIRLTETSDRESRTA